MSSNEFHINGKYGIAVALIAAGATLGASAMQLYKPCTQESPYKKIYLTKGKTNLYSLNYIVSEGVKKNIFNDFKEESFSINPVGNKVFYVERESFGANKLRDTIKIMNYDTSFSSEIKLSSYVQTGMSERDTESYYCDISIKGWEKQNSIRLGIHNCSESVGFTMMDYRMLRYPEIKMGNGSNFGIKQDGEYIIHFDEFNKVNSVSFLGD